MRDTLRSRKGGNYSAGFEIAPQLDFLRGLDLQATWYSVKINNPLAGGAAVNNQVVADPTQRFRFILHREELVGRSICLSGSVFCKNIAIARRHAVRQRRRR